MSYTVFAEGYDALTQNVDYDMCAAFVHKALRRYGIADGLVLDLACGTGSVSVRLAKAGYEVIGVDLSPDMLAVARQKAQAAGQDILLLCQDIRAIDLYGTVRAAVCTLDSLNHLPGADAVREALRRVALFLEPGGLFLFDVNTPYKHREILGNNTFVYDTDEVYCVWQNTALPDDTVQMDLDFFFPDEAQEDVYVREREQITERAYAAAQWEEMLRDAGFRILARYDGYTENPPSAHSERIVYAVQKE